MKCKRLIKVKFSFLLLFIWQIGFSQQPYELLITEIMADPTPTRGLPEKEYLELFNASNQPLQLADYVLHYNRFETTIPEMSLLPGEYVILLRNGNEAGFEDLGTVVSLPKLSLLNGGTTLRLSKGNVTVFEVEYQDSWYAPGKSEGFSLEMIDINYPCVGEQNWTSSLSEVGGTPGYVNASARTNPDITPPELLFYDAEIAGELSFDFNERLDTITISNIDNYILEGANGVQNIRFNDAENSFTLLLSTPLAENELIDISLRNITDCSGNVAPDIKLTLGNLAPADSGVVVLNEILFNPKLGGGDYIELYNQSENSVSLKNWAFANLNSEGELDNKEIITEFNLLFEPNSYLVFTENEDFLSDFYSDYKKENVVVVPNLPSMRNTDGTIFLLNENGDIFDQFDYDESFQHPIVDDVDGVALEKINTLLSSNTASNWQSAAAEYQYGTPGYKNSQGINEQETTNRVWIEPLIFTPNGDGFDDETQINFSFSKTGNVLNIHVFALSGIPLKTLAVNKLVGISGKLTWDGKDTSGNELPVGYYLIVIDVFNVDGTTKRYKNKVVLGRLN